MLIFFARIIDTFYLESVSQGGITLGEAKDLNEKMYLVVRSLKHNNNKIVSICLESTGSNQGKRDSFELTILSKIEPF